MKINLAPSIGFCSGVKKALEMIQKQEPCYLLHSPIHNKEVIKHLEEKGYKIIDETIYYTLKNVKVCTSAHGTNEQVREYATKNNIKLIDLTCPVICNINKIIQKNQNKHVFILGNKDHIEVRNLLLTHKNLIHAESIMQIIYLTSKNRQDDLVIYQSTYNPLQYEEDKKLTDILAKNFEIKNTICKEVTKRLKEIDDIKTPIIVLGDKTSSNANLLYNYAKTKQNDVYFVENMQDLQNLKLDYQELTLVSATSCSDDFVKKAQIYLEKI